MSISQELQEKAEARCGLGHGLVLETYPSQLYQELRGSPGAALLICVSNGNVFYGDYGGCSMLRHALNEHAIASAENTVLVIRYDSNPFWNRPTPKLFQNHVHLTLFEKTISLSILPVGNANALTFIFDTDHDRCLLDASTNHVLQIPGHRMCLEPVRDLTLSIHVFSQTLLALFRQSVARARDLMLEHAAVYVFNYDPTNMNAEAFGIVDADFFGACRQLMGSTSQYRLGDNVSGPHPLEAEYLVPIRAHYLELVQPHLCVSKILHNVFKEAHVDDVMRSMQLSVDALLP